MTYSDAARGAWAANLRAGRITYGRLGREGRSTPKASRRATVRDLEWAAGFLEGEGSFLKNGTSGAVTATQANVEPLLRLQAIFGGRVSVKHRAMMRPTWVQAHEWRTSGPRARGIMMTLYVLMSAKRQRQIKTALGLNDA